MKKSFIRCFRLWVMVMFCTIIPLSANPTLPGTVLAQIITEAQVSPDSIEIILALGESQQKEIKVITGSPPIPRVDVLFLFDVTSSMRDVEDIAKTQAMGIMSQVRDHVPDAAFGVASFCDYPGVFDHAGYRSTYGAADDYPWSLGADITSDANQVAEAIRALPYKNGQDTPEDYSRALYETGHVGWRAGSRRIVVLFGDAPAHDPKFYGENLGVDPGRDAKAGTGDDLTLTQVVAELKEQQIAILPVYLSEIDPVAARGFAYMAEQTGGRTYSATSVSDVPSAIVAGVEASTARINELRIHPPPEYAAWLGSKPELFHDVGKNEECIFRVTFRTPEDATPGIHEFPISISADGALLGQVQVKITVSAKSAVWGYVSDGHGHTLPGILVELLEGVDHVPPRSSSIASTITDNDGKYRLELPPASTGDSQTFYRTRVTLSHYDNLSNLSTGKSVFDLFYDGEEPDAEPVFVVLSTFELPNAGLDVEQSIDFGNFEPLPSGYYVNLSVGRIAQLKDLAGAFYGLYQAKVFAQQELGVSGFSCPLELKMFSSHSDLRGTSARAHMDGSPDLCIIRMNPAASDWGADDTSEIEWHEFGHYVMYDSYGDWPTLPDGSPMPDSYDAHAGYVNQDTTGSWAEGWADFFACAVDDFWGGEDPSSYSPIFPENYGGSLGQPDIEVNYNLWDMVPLFWRLFNYSDWSEADWYVNREELAVAGILWDMYDSGVELEAIRTMKDGYGEKHYFPGDTIDIDLELMWQTIANYHPVEEVTGVRNVKEFYKAFHDDPDLLEQAGVSAADIEGIFVAHGAFIEPSHYKSAFVPAAIGYSGGRGPHEDHLLREDMPGLPGAAVNILTREMFGNSAEKVTLTAHTEFEPPFDIYNRQTVAYMDGSEGTFYFEPPPPSFTSTTRIEAVTANGRAAEPWLIDNQIFWETWIQAMSKAGSEIPDHVLEHRFYFPGEPGETVSNISIGSFIIFLFLIMAGATFILLRQRQHTRAQLWIGQNGSSYLIPLKSQVTKIGRAPTSHLNLTDPLVSRTHARIVRQGKEYYIEDLGSKTGTFVNHKRVTRAPLADGDEIGIGGERLIFRRR